MTEDEHQKSAAEAEHDVAAARADLSGSIDALEARFSPEALVDTAFSYMRGDGRRHAEALVRNAKANPIALALIGAGLAWLTFGSNPSRVAGQTAGADRSGDTGAQKTSRVRTVAPNAAPGVPTGATSRKATSPTMVAGPADQTPRATSTTTRS